MKGTFLSAVVLLLFIVAFQTNVAPSAAEKSPTPSPSPTSPCLNICHPSRNDALLDCGYKSPIAGCEIVGCQIGAVEGTPGWACAESGATPSISASPTPSVTPTPSVALAPTAEDFTAMTLLRGTPLQDSRTQPATDGSGVMYNITYDVTITSDGIVSLDAVEEFANVECNTDGSVRIRLSEDIAVTNLETMYPERAILVIGRDAFGECNLAEETEIPDETEDDRDFRGASPRQALFMDAYLIIESVTGSPTNALIRGTPSSYFALFDSADIDVTPFIATPSASRQVLPVSARTFSLDFDSPLFSVGPLQLNVQGTGEYTGEFVAFRASWGLTSVNIEFVFINQWELSLNLDARLEVGGSIRDRSVVELLSIPLYGLPEIDFLNRLNNSRISLPRLRFGVFFEIPLIIGAEGSVGRDIGNVARASYTTTRTEVTMFFRGSFADIDLGYETRTLAPASRSFDFTPSFSSSSETEVEVSVFTGIRPQFAAYIPIFNARASIEIGVEIEGTWAPGAENAFVPIESGSVPAFGICDECHDIEVLGSGVIRNAGLFLSADLRIRVWRLNIRVVRSIASVTLPGNPSVSIDIAQGCFVTPMGEDGPLNFIAATDMCETCPEDMPTYNPTRQECEGECVDPQPFFNQATMECEACPPQTPTFNEELQICEGNCPGGTAAGNNIPFFGSFELGSPSGVFNFRREHFTVRDQMQVIYEGAVIHDTGCVGGSESIFLSYNGTATNVVVRVIPNCDGTSFTGWNFDVSCPTM